MIKKTGKKIGKKSVSLSLPALKGGKPVRKDFLPFFRPFVTSAEVRAVSDVIRSGWVSMGPKTMEFEKKLAAFVGAREVVAVSSCTAALHLSLLAYGIGRGDEVITTPFTFVATLNAIEHVGAKPVLADVDEETLNISPEEIRKKITRRTKAILPVHFAGQACDLNSINKIANENDLVVVEDAAHAIGTEYRGRKIGSSSLNANAVCFSFYANKNITTGDGGAVAVRDKKFADKLRVLRLHGMSRHAWQRYYAKNKWQYDVEAAGWKYNLTDIQAALGIEQLKKISSIQKKRTAVAHFYSEKLGKVEGLRIPEEVEKGHSWHIYPLRLETGKTGISRNDFITALSAENVGSGVHFIPVHLFSHYRKKYGFKRGDFPVAEKAFEQIVSLPLYARLSGKDENNVVNAVEKIISYYSLNSSRKRKDKNEKSKGW